MSHPEYAVLLDGEWGSGKTFFIRQFMDSFSEKGRKRFLYISLNGIKHTSEVDDLIFTELHPKLGGKIAKAGGSLVRSVLSVGLRYDLNGLSVSSSNAKTGLNLKDFLRNLKDKILIFDDLERCLISPLELLGYINRFVEHDQIPVICIANEKEIDPKVIIDSNDGENEKKNNQPKSNYVLIKEKVFGKTFRIQNELNEILDSIIGDIESKQEDYPTTFIKGHRHIILSAYIKSGLNNLRLLKNILVDWNQFWKLLDSDVPKKEGLLEELLETFLVLSLERLSGSFPLDSFHQYFSGWLYELDSIEQNTSYSPPKINNGENKYSFQKYNLDHHSIIMDLDVWDQWFQFGTLNKEILNSKIRESKYFYDENTPVWKKLFAFNQITEEEFDRYYKEFKENWTKKKERSPYVVMHYIGILQSLVKFQMIADYSLEEIERDGIKYLEEVFQDPGISQYSFRKIYMRDYGGLGYPNTDEFRPIRNKFDELVESAKNQILEQKAQEIQDLILSDFKKYEKQMYNYDHTTEYFNKAWLIKISPEEFYKLIASIETRYISNLANTLTFRMENHNCIQEEEGTHLENILKYIEDNLDQIPHQFRRGLIKRFFLVELKETLSKQYNPQNVG